MTVSNISSNDYYSSLSSVNTQATSHRKGQANPLSKALDSLQDALDSGDTSKAQSVLSDVLSHAPKSNSSGNGSNPGDKITDALKQIQSALSSGDTSGAQSALASLKDSLPKNRGPMAAVGAPLDGGTEPSDPLSKAIDSLQSALSSGDTSKAQSVLADLLAHAPKSSNNDSDDTSTESGDSSNPADEITSFLKQLKSALASNDTSSAQDLLSSLIKRLSSNTPPPPPGAGMYSTDGSFTFASSDSNQSLNLMA